MSGRALSAELAAVRALVADGLTEIGDAGDAGQVWIRSASARLTALDGVLTEAAGVLAAPVQIAALTVATFLVVAGSAAVAGALGLGSGGVLAVSGAAVLLMLMTTPYIARRVFALVGRHRLARAAASPRIGHAVTPAPALPSGSCLPSGLALPSSPGVPSSPGLPSGPTHLPPRRSGPRSSADPVPPALPLAPPHSAADLVTPAVPLAPPNSVTEPVPPALPLAPLHSAPDSVLSSSGIAGRHSEAGPARAVEGLLRARIRLVSAALRQAGAGNWAAPRLRRMIRTDQVIRRLAHADQLLCQAVDCIERHLDDQRKDAA
jgi:hypothetical protein